MTVPRKTVSTNLVTSSEPSLITVFVVVDYETHNDDNDIVYLLMTSTRWQAFNLRRDDLAIFSGVESN